ncbi:MAG: TldD/PmbA family protein [Burkholderiaceae bacterium]|nr:TldD/PmbA family protein [Burkholderiaceae bacterium]
MLDRIEDNARRAAPAVDQWAVRGVVECSDMLTVRHRVAQAPIRSRDDGAMVTVVDGGGLGYAATSDTSEAGLRRAFGEAAALARAVAGHTVFDARHLPRVSACGRYASAVEQPAATLGLRERLAMLSAANDALLPDARIVDSMARLHTVDTEQLFITGDGARIAQRWSIAMPHLQATARVGQVAQTRSAAGQYGGHCQQGGLEVLERTGFHHDGARVAQEAIELAGAAPCPSGTMDLILMPDQMMLQIHESIGHPLELDRILGDERSMAGTSFVTLDMFGRYRYGSELLNVTCDPQRAGELACFAFDDDGMAAEPAHIIRAGLLLRPLGGALSLMRAQAQRADIEGVATTRACSWNRPPIDRMSNLNVEPGDSTLAGMIEGIELGVLMRTNQSWSIDDSRNKFQFGCEHGQMIRHGSLAEVVRNPNYRGISATFWRSLARVGNAATVQVLGTPNCGKGDPSQVIRVGHASPACQFSRVAVFGGAA